MRPFAAQHRIPLAAALAGLVAAGASSCIPWPRHALKLPALQVSVTSDGGAVPEVRVTVVRYSFPHARVHEATTRPAADGGVAVFEEAREWETVWPLLPHGVPFYEFAWCVEAPDHDARVGPVPPDSPALTVVLSPGDAGCPSAQAIVDGARFSR